MLEVPLVIGCLLVPTGVPMFRTILPGLRQATRAALAGSAWTCKVPRRMALIPKVKGIWATVLGTLEV